MRIVIIGAGAIGCYLAAKLTAAGADCVLVARGGAQDAIAAGGIAISGSEQLTARPRLAAGIEEAGPADLVISAVKAFALGDIAPAIAAILKPGGAWLVGINGLPWWYGEGLAGPLAGLHLETLDPGRRIAAAIGPGRTLGAVLYLRSETIEPGVIRFSGGRGLMIGEPSGASTPRLAQAVAALNGAGIATSATTDIRSAVWNKLFGNVALNPLTAMTGLTVDRLLTEPALRAFLAEVMAEAQAIAVAAGATIEMDVAARIAFMAPLIGFRTSMLQDADAGRPLELAAILGAVVELADRLGQPAPKARLLHALAGSFARHRGLVPTSVQ